MRRLSAAMTPRSCDTRTPHASATPRATGRRHQELILICFLRADMMLRDARARSVRRVQRKDSASSARLTLITLRTRSAPARRRRRFRHAYVIFADAYRLTY